MKDQPFDFHGSQFTIKVLSSESNYQYTVLDVIHAANIGPAEHRYPAGPETFRILEGDYEFFLNGESIKAKVGDVICVPTGALHRFVAGHNGGHVIVISPPNLEFYFWKVSKLLAKGNVSFEQESEIGKKYGQIFSEDSKHWS
ncbi:MAG: cupin domain-containing protein [Nitrosopumilus sp.]|nr:MAG: cupin domain-containing protein [Nitrosopumilus sp.]QMU54821.1 MAG: cupin domain-containing protein [Nitrosopumilus sp.]